MKCDRAAELISASVMDGLNVSEYEELQTHLSVCESCVAEKEAYEVIWTDLEQAATPPPETNGLFRLQETLRTSRDSKSIAAKLRAFPLARWGQGVAAALLLVVVGVVGGVILERSRSEDSVVLMPDGPRFLLLMRGIDVAVQSDSTLDGAVGAWAGGLQEEQRLVDGAAMEESPGVWIGSAPGEFGLSGRLALDGFMIIRATNMEEARATAAQAPHLSAGGVVELWRMR